MANLFTLLGLGLLAAGARHEAERRAGGGSLGRAASMDADPSGRIRGEQRVMVGDLDQRVGLIVEGIRRDSLAPRVISAAREIVSPLCGDNWCIREKDYAGEVRAIFAAVKQPGSVVGMRYVRDHVSVDQFSSAPALMRMHAGDCDEMSGMLGSLLRSIGYPVKLRVIQDTESPTWSHIYPLAGLPPGAPTQWVALDATEPHPAGWEVPGARQCAATGRPSGYVVRVRDFDV